MMQEGIYIPKNQTMIEEGILTIQMMGIMIIKGIHILIRISISHQKKKYYDKRTT